MPELDTRARMVLLDAEKSIGASELIGASRTKTQSAL